MAQAREQSLAPHVAREAKHRVLDAVAAIVSGGRLKPGEMARTPTRPTTSSR
jgi:hypothetical protein